MHLFDITHDSQKIYQLKKNEVAAFYMINRADQLAFELTGPGATAHIFAFFIGKDHEKRSVTIIQRHLAPHTSSHTLVKTVLKDTAELDYTGTIHIEPQAQSSKASQESRSLLLSAGAVAHAKPALEILADNVECRHAATISPLNETQAFYAQSRGLSASQTRELLTQGFFNESLEKIEGLGIETSEIKERLHTLLT